MVGYLEQLNLTSSENSQKPSSSTESKDNLPLLPQASSVRNVTLCQDTVQLNTRKRPSECDLPGDVDMELATDDPQISHSRAKRLRIDVTANCPSRNCEGDCNVKIVHVDHAKSPTLMPSLSISSKSDIPNECDTARRLRLGAFCDHKSNIELTDVTSISVADRTRFESCIHFPLCPSPPSDLDVLSDLPMADSHHLWVAPELRRFCTSVEPLLPSGIVREM